jgi:hypothetical protein
VPELREQNRECICENKKKKEKRNRKKFEGELEPYIYDPNTV